MLASGKVVRVATLHVAVLDTTGETMTSRPLSSISSVSRDGVAVSIKGKRQRTLQIDMQSIDDAQSLEASIAAALGLHTADDRQLLDGATSDTWLASVRRQPFLMAGFACAALVMVGSLGPWITNASAAASGIDGDGAITLLLGAVAAALLFVTTRTNEAVVRRVRVLRVLAALTFLAAAVTGGNIMNTVWNAEGDAASFSVGWGLWIVVLASILGAGVAMVKPRTA